MIEAIVAFVKNVFQAGYWLHLWKNSPLQAVFVSGVVLVIVASIFLFLSGVFSGKMDSLWERTIVAFVYICASWLWPVAAAVAIVVLVNRCAGWLRNKNRLAKIRRKRKKKDRPTPTTKQQKAAVEPSAHRGKEEAGAPVRIPNRKNGATRSSHSPSLPHSRKNGENNCWMDHVNSIFDDDDHADDTTNDSGGYSSPSLSSYGSRSSSSCGSSGGYSSSGGSYSSSSSSSGSSSSSYSSSGGCDSDDDFGD